VWTSISGRDKATILGSRNSWAGSLKQAASQRHRLGAAIACLGLAPRLSAEVYERIADINAKGVTVLLVEQNTVLALEVAQRAYVIENGHIVLDGPARDLPRHPRVREAYLGA
jgi:hypothetical protein